VLNWDYFFLIHIQAVSQFSVLDFFFPDLSNIFVIVDVHLFQ